jgi:CRISPR/Cas system-associated endonuclease Cas3-HD
MFEEPEIKLYKVKWIYIDQEFENGEAYDVAYASTEFEWAISENEIRNRMNMEGGFTKLQIVEATEDETFAYKAGWDEGYDTAAIEERLKNFKDTDMNE